MEIVILKDSDHSKNVVTSFSVGKIMAAYAISVSGVVNSLGSTGKLRGFLMPSVQEQSKT